MVALLRGINLGPRNRVPMPELREALGEAGYDDVATVVQSGNIVLGAAAGPAELARDLQALIAERFGVDTPVVVRTAAQWRKVIAENPLPVPDGKRFQVLFFAERPAAEGLPDTGEERAVVRGCEIYCWHPDGIRHSPLVKALARLEGTATARNWNTVLKIADLL